MKPKFRKGEYVRIKNENVKCYQTAHDVYGEMYYKSIWNMSEIIDKELLIIGIENIEIDSEYNSKVYCCTTPTGKVIYVHIDGVEFLY